jgi:hypothetical protein
MGEEEPTHEAGECCEHGHCCREGQGHGHALAPMNELAVVGVITAIVFWPVGLITSLVARREARKRGERGEGLALVGICISALSGFFLTIMCVAVLAGGFGMDGPFRAHGEFGFIHQGTIMRVTPGGTQCTTLAPTNSGEGTTTCTNGGYVNPGGPMMPVPGSGSATSSSSAVTTGPGPSWVGVGGAGIGAVAGSIPRGS